MDKREKNLSRLRLGAVVFLVLLTFLPYIQKQSRIFPRVRLCGAEIKPVKPDLSLKAWFNGEYVKNFEKYFMYKVGFRGLCVKTVHQINFSVFNKAADNNNSRVVLGEDDYLYEHAYIEHYLNPRVMHEEERFLFTKDLKDLQDELQEIGIEFVLVIGPSKVSIMPEHLPKRFKPQADTLQPTDYDLVVPRLHAAGIRVVDGRAFFEKLRDSETFLFPPGGVHWSYYGSFLFCRHFLEQLQPELPGRIVLPELAGTTFMLPQGSDKDLIELLNLLFCKTEEIKVPYPDVAVEALPRDKRLNVLMIGDSFTFTIIDSLSQSKAVNKLDLFYYNKRHFDYPAEDMAGYFWGHADYEGRVITPDTVDWDKWLLPKDIVILEINEIHLKSKGWGFARNAVKFLRSRK